MTADRLRISRRRFLAGSLAAGAGLLIPGRLRAEPSATDANRFALLSDIHIAADRQRKARGINMADHLARVRDEILALRPRPATVIISGDCALHEGLPADYATLRELLEPLGQAGLGLHLMMGNHDRLAPLWEAFPQCKSRDAGLPPEKHVVLFESPHANWFLLDSMDGPGAVEGRLGEAQLQWLARSLDARADKPALVMMHHYPESFGKSGLADTEPLFQVIAPRKQVKAYLFGHSHRWTTRVQDGIHLVNLPAVAYVFDKSQPQGWVDAELRAEGMTLRLNAIDRKHPAHGKPLNLAWRK